MVQDASRLIFKQLQLLYADEILQKLLERERQSRLQRTTRELTGAGTIYSRPLYITKKRYTAVASEFDPTKAQQLDVD